MTGHAERRRAIQEHLAQQRAKLAALTVPCPFCFAEAGDSCINVMTDEPVSGVVHPARAKEQQRQESITEGSESVMERDR